MKKKGQEEIVGFVLIVVILAIALVIFIGIKLRNPEPVQKNSEILYQFIESSMEQTTDCVIRVNGKNLALNELIKECHSFDNSCLSGSNSCESVEGAIVSMFNATWKVGPEYPYKGYEVVGKYNSNSSSGQGEEIFSINQGNCSNNYIGNSYFIPQFPGNIVVQAKLCS
ncbi:MAG: hypothetical protein AABX23_00850 [Nanoarchaeota archaeon]